MVRVLDTLLVTAVTAAAVVSAEKIVPECGRDIGKCPENKPCCSQYGQCGNYISIWQDCIGAFCLGGCDSIFSHSLESCVPQPVCQNKKTTFVGGIDSVASIYQYLGDATKYDWVAEGKPVAWNDNLLLTMPPESVGTVLSSTHYIWYGKVSATLKTSRGKGVVSAFILFSGVKDEIDFEWIGVDLNQVQTNYYFQGITDYTNGGNTTVEGSSTYDEYHTYEIDWTPETITWSVDGKVGRVKHKKDTWNEKTKQFHFPQTPSRVQLSLWPGGLASNAPGTIEWAGGLIDWEHPDVKEAGYYYATVKELTIQCYDPPAGARKTGDKSYIYDNDSGLESAVVISDKDHVLKSFLGSGTDMDKEPPKASGTKSAVPTETDVVETIPGNTGGGTSTHDIIHSENQDSRSTDGNTDRTDNSLGDNVDAQDNFTQSDNESDRSDAAPLPLARGSILAVVIALAYLVAA
ncbi:cell wall glucanase [Kalaharituber pfeilii]|nr:cell wall glucanase [Kalaharituber pfeilii]